MEDSASKSELKTATDFPPMDTKSSKNVLNTLQYNQFLNFAMVLFKVLEELSSTMKVPPQIN